MKKKLYSGILIAIFLTALGIGFYEPSNATSDVGTKLNYNQLPATTPLYKKITLDSAQIVNMATTTFEVIPAPGAGKYIVPLQGFMIYNAGSTPYTGGNIIGFTWDDAENIFQHADPAGSYFLEIPYQALHESISQIAIGNIVNPHGAFDAKDTASNLPLKVTAPGTPFADGNGTIDIAVFYEIIQ